MVVKTKQRTAYSYARYSDRRQSRAESIQRQVDQSREYAAKQGWKLIELTPDEGKSGYHGRNQTARFGDFLDEIKSGQVEPGSALIVESVDRITRQGIDKGMDVCKQLLRAGVSIVDLVSGHEFTPATLNDFGQTVWLQALLERAYNESQAKFVRRSKGWKKARDKARTTGMAVTSRCPGWLTVTVTKDNKGETVDRRFTVKEEAAQIVARIFRLVADEGCGCYRTAELLNREGVPVVTGGRRWIRTTIQRIIRDKAVIGTYQPQRREGHKAINDGQPIENYYPAVVDRELFDRANACLDRRWEHTKRKPKGGRGGTSNLFEGLARDAESGEPMHLQYSRGSKGVMNAYVYLKPAKQIADRKRQLRVDYPSFERMALRCLKELKVSDIVGERQDPTEQQRLTDRLADLDGKLAKLKARAMASPDVDTFLDLIEQAHGERKQVAERLSQIEREAASQGGNDLTDAQGMIDLLDSATPEQLPELRRRLKAQLRRLISEAWLLVWDASKSVRVADVQFTFRTGRLRYAQMVWIRYGKHAGGTLALTSIVEGDKPLSGYASDVPGGQTRQFFTDRCERTRPHILQAVKEATA